MQRLASSPKLDDDFIPDHFSVTGGRHEPAFTADRRPAGHLDGGSAVGRLPNAWSVAPPVELTGRLTATCGARYCDGPNQADTLRMRFSEEKYGEIWQWLRMTVMAIADRQYHDLRGESDPQQAALALMQHNLSQNSRVDGGNPPVLPSAFPASAKTAGSGISAITICWWTASASQPIPPDKP
ncbi:hypothetical protein ACNKHQ_02885 [Shigella flexneri]